MSIPKLFISYSWSDVTHEQWVIDLATELRESGGVDVILDKWDLKEGHDAVAFMEKMVTDPDIKKVAIITDKVYAAKADGRAGGVGTETQIISAEVYSNQEQDKFVAIVSQKDEHGKPYLPAYYKSRIYIDLSEPDNYVDNYEKLLRWIFDKPLHVKPNIGKRPTFMDENEGVSLGTSVAYKKAISAIKENRPYAAGALDEYLSKFSENLERFRLKDIDGEFDEAVVNSVEQFLPYRNEAIQLFIAISNYAPTDDNVLKLHRFFESLIPYMSRQKDMRQWNERDFDNFKFIIHELFLYVVAILIKSERFDQANILLTQQYYITSSSDYDKNTMVNFIVFRKAIESLNYRNSRMGLNRLSVRADMLHQRSKSSGLEYRHLMQADFVLFMRAEIEYGDSYLSWWPDTLLYVGRHHSSFEIFARSVSKQFFDKVKCLLNIDKPADLSELLLSYKKDPQKLPRWDDNRLYPSTLIGFDQLATKV